MNDSDAIAELKAAQDAYNQHFENVVSIGSQPWSEHLVIFLSVSILLFTLLALGLSTALLWRRNADATEVLKLFGILLIVGLSALLLVTGFSNDQLTPIVGLFGAIAGYLLGKDGGTKTNP